MFHALQKWSPSGPKPHLQLQQLTVRNGTDPTPLLRVHNLYCAEWAERPADQLVPEPSDVLSKLWLAVRTKKRVLVHCASGAGRSAVFVLVYQFLERLRDQKPIVPLAMAKQLRERRHQALRTEAVSAD